MRTVVDLKCTYTKSKSRCIETSDTFMVVLTKLFQYTSNAFLFVKIVYLAMSGDHGICASLEI